MYSTSEWVRAWMGGESLHYTCAVNFGKRSRAVVGTFVLCRRWNVWTIRRLSDGENILARPNGIASSLKRMENLMNFLKRFHTGFTQDGRSKVLLYHGCCCKFWMNSNQSWDWNTPHKKNPNVCYQSMKRKSTSTRNKWVLQPIRFILL